MSYISLDGFSWYVDSDGNHRTAIARFDFVADIRTQLRGVALSHYRLDETFRALFARASDIVRQRRLGLLRHDNQLIHRDDAAGWKRDQHANTATLETTRAALRSAWPNALDTEGLRHLIAALERPAWRR